MTNPWRNTVRLLVIVATIAGPASRPLFAAPPPCAVKANVSPGAQTVPELTSGVPTIVQLNGEPSKPQTVAYSWQQVSGPPVAFDDPSIVKPTFTAPSVGPNGTTITIRLTVTGCSPSQTSSVDTIVNVTDVPTNLPPVAAITASPASTVNEGTDVTLDGSASSDPDGQPLAYTWMQTGGPGVALVPDSVNPAIVRFTAPGAVPYPGGASLTFRLTISDGSLTGTADQIVNVTWVNDPPVAAVACTSPVDEGATVTLDGSASSDTDGDGIASYAWAQTTGLPNADLSGVDLSQPSIAFAAPQLTSALDTMTFGLTVTDAGGLASAAECQVTVNDVTPPTISGADDVTAEATGASGAVVTFSPTAEDLVDGPVGVTCSPASGSTFPLGETAVSCDATDSAGNIGNATFSVTVRDTTPPLLTLPGSVVTEATGPSGAAVTYTASAIDLVDGSVTPACVPASGSTFALGTTTVDCSATDTHGNVASATFDVTVQDTTPPALALPADMTVEATASAGAPVSWVASAADLVDGAIVPTCSPASGSVLPLGATVVSCSTTDAHGNAARGSFDVSVTVSWSGVLQPINPDGSSIFKLGSTVPVKFKLTGASAGITNLAARIYVARITSGVAGTEVEATSTAAADSGNVFRYDGTGQQYIYNLATKGLLQGTWQIRIDLGDGVTNVVLIGLK